MSRFSHAAELTLPRIEEAVRRRLVLMGLAGAAATFTSSSVRAQTYKPFSAPVTGPDGITRTTLEQHSYEATGEEFRMVLNGNCSPPLCWMSDVQGSLNIADRGFCRSAQRQCVDLRVGP